MSKSKNITPDEEVTESVVLSKLEAFLGSKSCVNIWKRKPTKGHHVGRVTWMSLCGLLYKIERQCKAQGITFTIPTLQRTYKGGITVTWNRTTRTYLRVHWPAEMTHKVEWENLATTESGKCYREATVPVVVGWLTGEHHE